MMELYQILFFVFICTIPVAVVGFIYAVVLTAPDQIFETQKNLVINHLPSWLAMPLIACEKCVTGQLALWLFIFLICPLIGIKYNFFLHVYFIAQSILNVMIIKSIHENGKHK